MSSHTHTRNIFNICQLSWQKVIDSTGDKLIPHHSCIMNNCIEQQLPWQQATCSRRCIRRMNTQHNSCMVTRQQLPHMQFHLVPRMSRARRLSGNEFQHFSAKWPSPESNVATSSGPLSNSLWSSENNGFLVPSFPTSFVSNWPPQERQFRFKSPILFLCFLL